MQIKNSNTNVLYVSCRRKGTFFVSQVVLTPKASTVMKGVASGLRETITERWVRQRHNKWVIRAHFRLDEMWCRSACTQALWEQIIATPWIRKATEWLWFTHRSAARAHKHTVECESEPSGILWLNPEACCFPQLPLAVWHRPHSSYFLNSCHEPKAMLLISPPFYLSPPFCCGSGISLFPPDLPSASTVFHSLVMSPLFNKATAA